MVKECDIHSSIVTRPCTKKLAQNIYLRNFEVDITQLISSDFLNIYENFSSGRYQVYNYC